MAKGLFDLSGKVAVVTGGNSGIGLGFARGLVKHGATVEIWGRSADKNVQARAELAALGAQVIARQVDVATEADVVAAFDATVRDAGRVDFVFANAGVPPSLASTVEMTRAQWRSVLDINMDGAFFTLREGARRMIARAEAGEPGGSLVFCGSLSMFDGVPGVADYAAAKAGMGAYIRTMASELGRYGIRANSIAPGYISTNIAVDKSAMAEMEAFFASKTPLARVGTPEDLEGIAVYLASDASSYHSGDTLVIDGAAMVFPAYAMPS